MSGPPPARNRIEEGHHPTPFSAKQIRDGCASGRRSVFRITEADAPPKMLATWFENSGEHGVVVAQAETDSEGRLLGEARRTRAGWDELRAHASYPEDGTRIELEKIEIVAGTFDCWCYITDGPSDGAQTRAWFARGLPGPPVLRVTTDAGHEVFRAELVEYDDPREEPA